jgi:hypothetical protein
MKNKTHKCNLKSHKNHHKSCKNVSSKRKQRGSGIGTSRPKPNPFEELTTLENNQSKMTVLEKINIIKNMTPNLGKILHVEKQPNEMSLKELLAAIDTLGVNKGNAIEKDELVVLLNNALNHKTNKKIDKMLSDVLKDKRKKLEEEQKKLEEEQKKLEQERKRMEEEKQKIKAEKKMQAEILKQQQREEAERQYREAEIRNQQKQREEESRFERHLREEQEANIRFVNEMEEEERLRNLENSFRNRNYYNSRYMSPSDAYYQALEAERYRSLARARYHQEAQKELNAIPPELRQGSRQYFLS